MFSIMMRTTTTNYDVDHNLNVINGPEFYINQMISSNSTPADHNYDDNSDEDCDDSELVAVVVIIIMALAMTMMMI